MTPRDILAAARTSLKRGQPAARCAFFYPAPRNPNKQVFMYREVFPLIEAGLLMWGNRSRSFCVLTEAGREAIGEIA